MITECMKNIHGSVLVGVVVLVIVMTIGGIGFIQVATISINNETAVLENDKAFQAAESGIWIGARWLRGFEAFLSLMADCADIGPFGSTPISINGMDVYIKIPVRVGVDYIPVAQIVANVYKGGLPARLHLKNALALVT